MPLPSRGYLVILGLAALGCLLAALIGHYRFGSSLYLYTDVKGKPGVMQGAMTAVSSFLLVVTAVFCGQLGAQLRRRHQRRIANLLHPLREVPLPRRRHLRLRSLGPLQELVRVLEKVLHVLHAGLEIRRRGRRPRGVGGGSKARCWS